MLKAVAVAILTLGIALSPARAGPAPDPGFMTLANVLMDWVVAHTRYGPPSHLPAYVFVPVEVLNYVFYHNMKPGGYTGQNNVAALYADMVIMLPDDYDIARSPELLVHEFVHHLQRLAEYETKIFAFPCPAAKEVEAYETQNLFVETFGVGKKVNRLSIISYSACNPYDY